MTYRPRRLDPPTAGQAAMAGDLVPWREAARLLLVTPKTVAHWMDRGRLGFLTVEGRRLVSLSEASGVERETRRAGKRKMTSM